MKTPYLNALLRLAVPVLITTVVTPIALAQDIPSVPAISDSTRVHVVNVEVHVTDKKGRPITGLKRDDFILREDGQVMEIANFYAVENGGPVSVQASADRRGADPVDPAGAADVEPLHLVVLFDNDQLAPGGRKRVLRDLGSFLDEMLNRTTGPPVDVMVVSRDRRTLHTLLPFSSDAEAVGTALAALAERPASGNAITRERSQLFNSIMETYQALEDAPFVDPCGDGTDYYIGYARAYGESIRGHATLAVNDLFKLSSGLAGLSGRKAVIYVGDGMAQRPALDVYHYLEGLCPGQRQVYQSRYNDHDATRQFQELTEHANANRVTFYTLEAAGLRGFSLGGAEIDDRKFAASPLNDQMRIANLQSSLFQIANETGGQAVLNANDFASALDGLATDFGTYYSLGYTPPHDGDGRQHVIRVELRDRKGRVRHRHAYRDKPAEETLAERTLGTLLFGLGENPLGAAVEVAEQSPAAPGFFAVRLAVAVPYGSVTRLPAAGDDGVEAGSVRLVLTARDAADQIVPLRQQRHPVRTPADARPDGAEILEIGLELAAGHWRLAIAIEDEIGGGASFIAREIDVGT